MNIETLLQFNKEDIDVNRLIRAIKILVEKHPIFQSIFFQKDGKYHIKHDKNLYPEIIQKTIKEDDFKSYLEEIEQHIEFSLNQLMHKYYLIQTEKSLFIIMYMHHAIVDKISADAFLKTLNKIYVNETIPFQSEDLYYASLYEYNLKTRNDRKLINDVQNYFFNNYDLGRTFKGFRLDKDIQYPLKDTVNFFIDISSKSLRDKVYSIFNGKFSEISKFNMICQLYTLYLYNNMEDPKPEITTARHGRNFKFYRNTVGCLIQFTFINYDFAKNSIKINNKNYLNVQNFFDDVKRQFEEQKELDRYINCLDNYNPVKSNDNLISAQSYEVNKVDEMLQPQVMPKYLFGKKLQEKTRNILVPVNNNESAFARFFFQNLFIKNGIITQFQTNSDSYTMESLKKICDLFYKVVDTLSDGLASNDKLVEIKMLS